MVYHSHCFRSLTINTCFPLLLIPLLVFGQGSVPLLLDNKAILNVTGDPNVDLGWLDSYSVGNECYCDTSYDHDIGTVIVTTPLGNKTVREVCTLLGPGPGRQNRPVYNDIQCGNGPPNNAGDEQRCPGRVDHGVTGCKYIGPTWNFAPFIQTKKPTKKPTKQPTNKPTNNPTKKPTIKPTFRKPTALPVMSPTPPQQQQTSKPTKKPTQVPVISPTTPQQTTTFFTRIIDFFRIILGLRT